MLNRFGQLFLISNIFLFLFTAACASAAEDMQVSSERKTGKLERFIYGDSMEGDLAERIQKIEADLLGRNTGQTADQKLDVLSGLIFKGTQQSPSLSMKMNFLEWKIFKKSSPGSLIDRIAALDVAVIGIPSREPLAFRVEQLMHLILEQGFISLHRVVLPRGAKLRLRLDKQVSSKTAKQGDEVYFSILDDIFVEQNILVASKGGILEGEIQKVRRGGRFGRSGYIHMNIESVTAIDSTPIPVKFESFGDERANKKQMGIAIGASAVGYLAMGPVGIVGGAFIKGKDVTIPEGTEINVTTTEDCYISGVVVR